MAIQIHEKKKRWHLFDLRFFVLKLFFCLPDILLIQEFCTYKLTKNNAWRIYFCFCFWEFFYNAVQCICYNLLLNVRTYTHREQRECWERDVKRLNTIIYMLIIIIPEGTMARKLSRNLFILIANKFSIILNDWKRIILMFAELYSSWLNPFFQA